MYRALLAALLLAGPTLAQDDVSTLWWESDRAVSLALRQRNVGEWARELAAKPMPKTTSGCFERLQVLALAGHAADARRVLDHLAELPPEQQADLKALADFLIGRDDWLLAKYAHERLPHMEGGWTYILVRHLARTEEPDDVERWLKHQASRSRLWVGHRIWFAQKRGRADTLFRDLEKNVTDLQSLQFLLTSMSRVHAKRRLDWLPGRLQPKSAYASYHIGCTLGAGYDCVALVYLEQALRLPVTDEDRAQYEAQRALLATFDVEKKVDLAELVPAWAKRRLMGIYLRINQPKRAQALLEELAVQYPNGVPNDMLQLAGMVQASSGESFVRERVENAPGKDTVAYWLNRVDYYVGRKEHDEVEASYREALRLARDDMHRRVVLRYADWTAHIGVAERAHTVLLDALRKLDAGNDAANSLLERLPISAETTRLSWKHLAASKQWDGRSQAMLKRLADDAGGVNRPAVWKRGEGLVRDNHPSRACVLAWVMMLRKEQARASVLLRTAIQRMPPGDARRSAEYNLYRSLRESGNWKAAREAWPAARELLGPREVPNHLAELAVCAAKAGASGPAMDIWKRRTNYDRMNYAFLDKLADTGLRDELLKFYRALARDDPKCVAPAGALTVLAERR